MTEFENEVVLAESRVNHEAIELVRKQGRRLVVLLCGGIILFPVIVGAPEGLPVFLIGAIAAFFAIAGAYGNDIKDYQNKFWIVTDKGLVQIRRDSDYKLFVSASEIGSVSQTKDSVSVRLKSQGRITLNCVENVDELVSALMSLIQ